MSEESAAKLVAFLASDWYLPVIVLILIVVMGAWGGEFSIGGNDGGNDGDGGGDGGGGD